MITFDDTNRLLYVYSGGVFYDISPIKSTTTLSNAFSTTNGSAIVTLTFASAHNANAGDIILLDGIDSDSTDAGRALLFESDEELHTAIALETTNKIPSEGQIPIDNWTLNTSVSSIGGLPIVRSSEIRTRTTGDIALEDGFGNLVLNGTDGSSTNAGDNMDLEGATGITI